MSGIYRRQTDSQRADENVNGFRHAALPLDGVGTAKTNNWSYLDQLAGKSVSIDQLDGVVWSAGWFGPTAAFGWFQKGKVDERIQHTLIHRQRSFWLGCLFNECLISLNAASPAGGTWDPQSIFNWVSSEDECASGERSANKKNLLMMMPWPTRLGEATDQMSRSVRAWSGCH